MGCVWMQNKWGVKVGHTEGCRIRLETKISEDSNDDRAKKAKED